MTQTITSSGALDPHLALMARLLPDGRRAGDVPGHELARILIKGNVAGASHANGRMDNLRAFDAHMAAIERDGGVKAAAEWLEQHRP